MNEKYTELKNLLIRANDAYYKDNQPIMSDYEFDSKLRDLQLMEFYQQHADPDSPTQKPGSDLLTNGKRHRRPMLSLQNTYNREEVTNWFNDVKPTNDEVVIEPKYDGGSAAIYFINGKVVKALTRGDGEVGEDITQNVSLLDWSKINPAFTGEVRGELIITKEGFSMLNKDGKYQNARNLLAGSMKLLDPEEFKKRAPYIRFYAYWNEDIVSNRYLDDVCTLKDAGFRVNNPIVCSSSLEAVLHAISILEKEKNDFEFDIDGAVLKINDKRQWKELGETAKFPRWAKAYKFVQDNIKATVNKITFEVGRTGKITPLCWFTPTMLDGSLIQKATLNNKEFYTAMDIAIGDVVTVQKAAAIIPQIIGVERVKDRKIVPFPVNCPCCGYPLKKHNDDHADVYCDNPNCKEKIVDIITNYTHSLEIDGFAEIITERLHSAGLLDSILDLYKLKDHITEISKLDRLSEDIARKLTNNIEAAKSQEFWKLLAGLGIPNVGPKTAKTLANHFKGIDRLRKATKSELVNIQDIAEITAEGIYNWFNDSENIKLIDGLISEKQNMTTKTKTTSSSAAGKIFCITGALSKPRKIYEELIESLGGKISSSISSKTNYLITNDTTTTSSKNLKAKELGIPILSEVEFLKLFQIKE